MICVPCLAKFTNGTRVCLLRESVQIECDHKVAIGLRAQRIAEIAGGALDAGVQLLWALHELDSLVLESPLAVGRHSAYRGKSTLEIANRIIQPFCAELLVSDSISGDVDDKATLQGAPDGR